MFCGQCRGTDYALQSSYVQFRLLLQQVLLHCPDYTAATSEKSLREKNKEKKMKQPSGEWRQEEEKGGK